MRSSIADRIMSSSPEETRQLAGVYADLVVKVNQVIRKKKLTDNNDVGYQTKRWLGHTFDFSWYAIKRLQEELGENILPVPLSDNEYDMVFIRGVVQSVDVHRGFVMILGVDSVEYKILLSNEQMAQVLLPAGTEVMVSAWISFGLDGAQTLVFCDSYPDAELFEDLKQEVAKMMLGTHTEPLLRIHRKFKEFIVARRFPESVQYIRLFTHPMVDIHKMRTMLVACKFFRDQDGYRDVIETVARNLEYKVGKKLN